MDQVISLLAAVTLIEMMLTTGLSVRLADVIGTARDRKLVLRAGLANYVAVPMAAVLLLSLTDVDPMVAAGFLILAVCPGAPYAPPLTALAGGATVLSVGLMVILASSSVIVAPLLLSLLLPLATGRSDVHVAPLGMLEMILATQLIPLCCGLVINHRQPELAARLLRPAIAVSKVLNAALLALILTTQFPRLVDIGLSGILGVLVLLGVGLSVGWSAGGPWDQDRKAIAFTTSIRNAGLGIEITASAFAGTSAVTTVLVYGLIQVLGSFLLALLWRRSLTLAEIR